MKLSNPVKTLAIYIVGFFIAPIVLGAAMSAAGTTAEISRNWSVFAVILWLAIGWPISMTVVRGEDE